jgi:hypothetical protein
MLQQTPSVQWPELHSPSRPQAAPAAFFAAQAVPVQ